MAELAGAESRLADIAQQKTERKEAFKRLADEAAQAESDMTGLWMKVQSAEKEAEKTRAEIASRVCWLPSIYPPRLSM